MLRRIDQFEHLRALDDGDGLAEFLPDLAGEFEDVHPLLAVFEDFEQADHPPDGNLRDGFDPLSHGLAARSLRGGRRRGSAGFGVVLIRQGERGDGVVDDIHEVAEILRIDIARIGERIEDDVLDPPGMRGDDDDARGHEDGLRDVVRDEKDALEIPRFGFPEVDDFRAKVLRREHVERAESLVHAENLRLRHDGPREADPLPHAAGKLLGIRILVAGEADQRQRALDLLLLLLLG